MNEQNSQSQISLLLDACDELSDARNMVKLIAMTARSDGDDNNAIHVGCTVVLEFIKKTNSLMQQAITPTASDK